MPITREIRNLDELMDGGVNERFNQALQDVMRNIYDPNTSPTKKRRITMTVDFTPNKSRDVAELSYDVKITPAPPMALTQTIFISQNDDGSVRAVEHSNQIPGQVDIEGEVALQNVIDFGKGNARHN